MSIKNKKYLKTLKFEDLNNILTDFQNKKVYSNDTESSLKQMMTFLNNNEVINGERKLGKEVKVELHHSSFFTRLKSCLLMLSSHIKIENKGVYKKPDADIEILIYEDSAYRGFIKNINVFFGKIIDSKLLHKNDYLNYVLSHEYGHLKHFEWQTDNNLFCPLTDRKSLFMNLIIEPEILKDSNVIKVIPEFMNKKIVPTKILEDEKPTRKMRNSLSFLETFADIYSLICLKKSYDKETYEEIKKTVLNHRLKENKTGSPYYTSDAIKEFIESEPENLNTKENIMNYVMDISLRNGFKHFINKYNNELESWTNVINGFGEVKGKYKEYEKDLFCEIAFLAGGLIPNAINNDLTKNMEILENEFGIKFGFKNNNRYIANIKKLYNSEINLYIMSGKNKNNMLYKTEECPINIINNNSDKDLVAYINDKITFLEKSTLLIDEDTSISSMFNNELNKIYYIAGFLSQKQAIKNDVDIITANNKNLLNSIGIDFDRIEILDEAKQYCSYLRFDKPMMNYDMFADGKLEAKKRASEIKDKLSISSVLEKLKNTNSNNEENILNKKKGISFN